MTSDSFSLDNQMPAFGVSDFVAVFNQTLEYAYPTVSIVGELSDFRVSKNRWVYFDLKDESSSVKFFGTVYQTPGPLEDGMMLEVRGQPRLHPLYGFSVNIQSVRPVGEGSIKKASALLEAKLAKEGLFETERKRTLPFPPKRIGLVTAQGSAAYHDFIKIVGERWSGLEIIHTDTQVQGEAAISQIVAALDYFNAHETVDVVVVTRGGGSPDDLAAFNTEPVVRAIAGSRAPTIVAIGHEVDISLAELAADQRASTPTNAAQILVPDKQNELMHLKSARIALTNSLKNTLVAQRSYMLNTHTNILNVINFLLEDSVQKLVLKSDLLLALSPEAALKRGYALLKQGNTYIKSVKQLNVGDNVNVLLSDGNADASISSINS